jgi:thioredoxin
MVMKARQRSDLRARLLICSICFAIMQLMGAAARGSGMMPPSFLKLNSVLSVPPADHNVECKDGVCEIKPRDRLKKSLGLSHDGPDSRNLVQTKTLSDMIIDEKDEDTTSKPPDSTESEPKVKLDEDKLNTLQNMGWSRAEAEEALRNSNGNVEEAADALTVAEEQRDLREAKLEQIEGAGWAREAGYIALLDCDDNVGEALGMLEREEEEMREQFEAAVADMLTNGWNELVARQALVSQWRIDQRKLGGFNEIIDPDILKQIRPTLKQAQPPKPTRMPSTTSNQSTPVVRQEQTSASVSPPSPQQQQQQQPQPAQQHQQQPQQKNAAQKPPARAKKEDCVFDVTIENFQQVVLESPVPVLVDVYADWCGPCKQLGPILEEAAMKSGGMFRLAKVNSDMERTIPETLAVQGLPTVYTVRDGKLNDRFVGMLPQDQLQRYLVRAITGFGERVQRDQVSDEALAESTRQLASAAGLASLSGATKSLIKAAVEAALSLPGAGALDDHGNALHRPSDGLKTALAYINNAAKDISNVTFRSISLESKAFSNKVRDNAPALAVLKAAGFSAEGTPEGVALMLTHTNAAQLTMVKHHVSSIFSDRKFSRMRVSEHSVESLPSKWDPTQPKKDLGDTRTQGKSKSKAQFAAEQDSSKEKEKLVSPFRKKEMQSKKKKSSTAPPSPLIDETAALKKAAKATPSGIVTVSVRDPKGQAHSVRLADSDTLRAAAKQLLGERAVWADLEIKNPLPRRSLGGEDGTGDKALLKQSLAELAEGSALTLAFAAAERDERSGDGSSPPKVTRRKKRAKGGEHTLLSTGIHKASNKKNNEYFGGDSTVYLAGEDKVEDKDEDKDEEGGGKADKGDGGESSGASDGDSTTEKGERASKAKPKSDKKKKVKKE